MVAAGFDTIEKPEGVRKRIKIVFQDPSLGDQLTRYDNMYIHGKLYGLKLDRATQQDHSFARTREPEGVRSREGYALQQWYGRHLEIAQSLPREPEILILNEPTLGLGYGSA